MIKRYALPFSRELFEHISKESLGHLLFQFVNLVENDKERVYNRIIDEYNHLLEMGFYAGKPISDKKRNEILDDGLDRAK